MNISFLLNPALERELPVAVHSNRLSCATHKQDSRGAHLDKPAESRSPSVAKRADPVGFSSFPLVNKPRRVGNYDDERAFKETKQLRTDSVSPFDRRCSPTAPAQCCAGGSPCLSDLVEEPAHHAHVPSSPAINIQTWLSLHAAAAQAGSSAGQDKQEPTSARACFECSLCGLTFTDKRSLGRHIINAHHEGRQATYVSGWVLKEEVPRRCEICGRNCSNRAVLRAHVRVAHATSTGFKCSSCWMVFKSKGNLIRHCYSKHLELITN